VSIETEPDPARWRALALCLVAGFMTLLDVSIVNVALPSIRTGLGASESAIQWIIAGYALAFGIALVPAGRLGDARSRRAIFGIGLGLFTVASAACGLATGPTWLSVTRVLQGLGAGIVSPQVSGFIQTMFSGRERGRAFGMFGATIGISTAIGPLLGGFIVKVGGVENGWRWVFLVNVPVGIVALLLVRRLLPASTQRRKQSLDPVGVVLFGGAILFALLPLVTGDQDSLSNRSWWLLIPSALLLVAFGWWERMWDRRGAATLVDLSLLRVRSFMLGLGLGTVYFAGFTSLFLVLTLYLQAGLHYDALLAGVTSMPFAIGSAVSASLGGKFVYKFGRPMVVAGLVLVIIGLIGVDLVVGRVDQHVGAWLIVPLAVTGFGGGLVISPNVTLTLAEVDVRRAGSGGGMLQTAQRVGSAIGVAVVLAQFFSKLASTHGDFAKALSLGLRTTIGLVAAALVLGLVDLLTRRGHDTRAATRESEVTDREAEPAAVGAHAGAAAVEPEAPGDSRVEEPAPVSAVVGRHRKR